MKTVIKILAGLFLLAVMYFIAADGMMVHFGLKQSVQYAFNLGAIVVLIPLCIHFLFPFEEVKPLVTTANGSSLPMEAEQQQSAQERG